MDCEEGERAGNPDEEERIQKQREQREATMEDRGNTEERNWRAEDKQRRLNIGHYQGAAAQ